MRRTQAEFIGHDWPQIEMLLDPWLPCCGIASLSAWRGVGKSYACLGIAEAVASGGTFLGWKAPEPRGVLYVDGEMNPRQTANRLRAWQASMGKKLAAAAAENLRIVTHADFPNGLHSMADPLNDATRWLVETQAADCDLVILDNLACLARPPGVSVSDELGWRTTMQPWALKMRRAGKSILFVEHTTKPDRETGFTSSIGSGAKDGVSDAAVLLDRPRGWPRDFFRWDFDKSRGFLPEPRFAVRIYDSGLKCELKREEPPKPEKEEKGAGATHDKEMLALAWQLYESGLPQAKISKRTGIPQQTLSRMFAKRPRAEDGVVVPFPGGDDPR